MTTASQVVNDTALVKNATRARVMNVVGKSKYSPNLPARSLATGKSRSIGVIVSNMENPFFLDIYKAVEIGAQEAGYELLTADAGYSPERLLAGIRFMIGRRVEGLAAIVPDLDSNLVEELTRNGISAVLYDVGAPRHGIPSIRIQYRRGMQKVISYLHSLGHRRLGFVGHRDGFSPIDERFRAFADVAASYPDVTVEKKVDADTLEGGRCAARALRAADPSITAFICGNDLMAIGALRELRENGLRVPADVSVTGFDNVKLAEFSCPALTTVHIPRDQIGRAICDWLLKPEDPLRESEVVIEPELVLRDSTGPAARRESERARR